MKPSKYVTKAIIALLFLAAVAYFGVYAYRTFYGSYETATVYLYSSQRTLPARGWLIRRETVLPGSSDLEDIVVAEGENVAYGDVVARVYGSQDALARHRELEQMESELQRLNYILERGTEETDAVHLDERIVDSITSLRFSLGQGELGRLGDQLDHLEDLIFRRDYTYSSNTTLSAQIDSLNSQIISLQNATQSATDTVYSPAAGIFSATVDGYEGCFDLEQLHSLTPETLREMAGRRENTTGRELGKIITSFDWYYAAIMDQEVAKHLSTGSTAVALFDAAGDQKMTVEYISAPNASGEVVLLLHSNRELNAISQLREQNGEVAYGTYTGLRIPARALRADQQTGQLGVYRISGAQAEWVPVELLYSGSDYYLVRSLSQEDQNQLQQAKMLREGDEILMRGKDIYDGKVIE